MHLEQFWVSRTPSLQIKTQLLRNHAEHFYLEVSSPSYMAHFYVKFTALISYPMTELPVLFQIKQHMVIPLFV